MPISIRRFGRQVPFFANLQYAVLLCLVLGCGSQVTADPRPSACDACEGHADWDTCGDRVDAGDILSCFCQNDNGIVRGVTSCDENGSPGACACDGMCYEIIVDEIQPVPDGLTCHDNGVCVRGMCKSRCIDQITGGALPNDTPCGDGKTCHSGKCI